MVGWSHLPPEIKQHVVKKLDFMSRHSLKCTSYTDRQIVNSTPLKIPRVRFGHKDGRCLIVIYTGVEEFLRWELFDDDDGVLLGRSENCYDTDKCILIENVEILQMGIHILKTLLAHESIKIDVFEWDIPCEIEDEVPKNMSEIEEYLDGDNFRATEVSATSFFRSYALLNFANRVCTDVKKLNMLYRDQADDNIVPREIIEYPTVTDDISWTTTFILYQPNDRIDSSEYSLEQTEELEKTIIHCMIEKVLGANKIPAPQIQRSEEEGMIKLTFTTKCGKYTITMLPEDEQFFRGQFIDMKCGMSFLCKKCADPFEYWYHQNLTMRIIHEPFWAFGLDGSDKLSPQLMYVLKEKSKKRLKTSKSSWGFKKIPPELQPTKNPTKSQKLKKEVKNIKREETTGKTTGISKFFIWFGISIVGYIAFSVLLNFVK